MGASAFLPMMIGGAMDTIGTIGLMGSADKRRREAFELANTPGIDFTMLAREAIGGYNANFAGAKELSKKLADANQEQLLGQWNAISPGLLDTFRQAQGQIGGLFADDATYVKGLQRRAGALGLGRGTGGSPATQFAGLKLSDTEHQQRIGVGTSLLGSLVGSMRHLVADSPAVQNFLGNSMSEQLATRSNERSKRLDMLSAAQGMPTGSELLFQRLQQVGTTLAGAGSVGASPLGSGYGGGGATAQGNPWAPGGAASNYYGLQDPVGYGFGGGSGGWGTGAGISGTAANAAMVGVG